ncbi:MAG: tetratricopeptide repeat protein [Elusimicrobia bacterium]|nr:tetratricopeptide repeat protein [Elusimicrobiota bacterium]
MEIKKAVLAAILPALLAPGPLYAAKRSPYFHYLQAVLHEKTGEYQQAIEAYQKTLELDPQAAFVHRQIAELYLQMNQPQKARDAALRAAKLEPDDAEVLYLLGSAHWALGELEEAKENFEKILQIDPQYDSALLSLAQLHLSLDLEKSEHYLKRYLQLHPNSLETHTQLALLQQKRGKLQEAEQSLRQALDANPGYLQARYHLAQLYEIAKDTSAALEQYLKIHDQNSTDAQVTSRLGELFYFSQQNQKAEEFFQQTLKLESNDPTARLWLALLAEEAKNWSLAQKHLQKLASLSQDPKLHLRLSYYQTQQGKIEEAVGTLKEARRLWPQDAEIAYFLSLGYEDLGRYDPAIQILEEVLQARPEEKLLRFQLGALYEKAGDVPKMEKHFRTYLSRYPEDASALNYLGYSLVDRDMKLQQAQELLQKALKIDPDNGAYLDSWGWLLFKKGEPQKALEPLERALKKVPQDPVISEHLGEVYLALKESRQAWLAFRRALPGHSDQSSIRKRLARIESQWSPEKLAQQLLRFLHLEHSKIQTLRGRIQLEGKIHGQHLRFHGWILYEHPERLLLEFIGPFWVPAWKAQLQGESFQMTPLQIPGIPEELVGETAAASLQILRSYLSGELFSSSGKAHYRSGWWKSSIEAEDRKWIFPSKNRWGHPRSIQILPHYSLHFPEDTDPASPPPPSIEFHGPRWEFRLTLESVSLQKK